MAEGDASEKVFFPGAVINDDDTPKSGYFTLRLTFPDMEGKSEKKLFKDTVHKVKNGSAEIKIDEEEVSVKVTVEVDGKPKKYAYIKKLPVKINKSGSEHKLVGEEVVLIFKKTEDKSMGQYAKYFRTKPETPE